MKKSKPPINRIAATTPMAIPAMAPPDSEEVDEAAEVLAAEVPVGNDVDVEDGEAEVNIVCVGAGDIEAEAASSFVKIWMPW
jgi:hypothetical protein